MKILKNSIQCNKCKDILISEHRHDFKICSCNSVGVDGGVDYLKRTGKIEDWTDLSETIINKLRLLLFENCNRNCKGCCNKDWELNKLEVETDFSSYDEILLTGGEPMLNPSLVIDTIMEIRKQNPFVMIYMYTAKVDNLTDMVHVLTCVDGITVTLHDESDITPFSNLVELVTGLTNLHKDFLEKSYRVNIFKEVIYSINISTMWKVKNNIKWIKNCPLPENEVFKRLKKKGE